MSGVFLSYRRADSGAWIGRLQERLELRFGEDLVARDMGALHIGDDFVSQLRALIRRADAVLVVIGPRWLERGAHGMGTRLRSRRDVLRREVAWALAHKRKRVIPVLVGGATMPDERTLPPSIRRLHEHQAQSLSDDAWDSDCDALFEGLRHVLHGVREPVPLDTLRAKITQRRESWFEVLLSDPKRAIRIMEATLRLLNRQAPFHPHDTFLQLTRAYIYKDIAVARAEGLGLSRRDPSVKLALNRSEAVSQAIHAEAAEGYASVCSLIASMAALRGDLQVALTWINKALVVVPNNQSAKHDRATFQVLARGASSGVTRQSRKDLVSTEEGWERHHRRGEVR